MPEAGVENSPTSNPDYGQSNPRAKATRSCVRVTHTFGIEDQGSISDSYDAHINSPSIRWASCKPDSTRLHCQIRWERRGPRVFQTRFFTASFFVLLLRCPIRATACKHSAMGWASCSARQLKQLSPRPHSPRVLRGQVSCLTAAASFPDFGCFALGWCLFCLVALGRYFIVFL